MSSNVQWFEGPPPAVGHSLTVKNGDVVLYIPTSHMTLVTEDADHNFWLYVVGQLEPFSIQRQHAVFLFGAGAVDHGL